MIAIPGRAIPVMSINDVGFIYAEVPELDVFLSNEKDIAKALGDKRKLCLRCPPDNCSRVFASALPVLGQHYRSVAAGAEKVGFQIRAGTTGVISQGSWV